MENMGFHRGQSTACVFHHGDKDLLSTVHGDDFAIVGPKPALDWFRAELEKRYELKQGARLGASPDDNKETRVLNRMVRWTDDGIEYEADPRQGEKLLQELGLENCKPMATPGVKQTIEQINSDKELPEDKISHFRALAARSNYLAADRPDCKFAAKEVCRFMAKPTHLSVEALKRIGRYLEGRKRVGRTALPR